MRSKEVDVKGQLASRVQGDVWAWVMTNGQVLVHGLGTAEGAYVGVCDSCHLWGLPRGLWLGLDPEITLVSKGHTATGAMPVRVACADTWDLCIICPELLPRTMSGSVAPPQPGSVLMSMVHVATKGRIDSQGLTSTCGHEGV